MANEVLWSGAIAALCGVAMLRWSWSLARRSAAANAIGWGLLLGGCIAGGASAGAWGVSVVALLAMAAAAVVLGWAAAISPAGREKGSARRVRMLPESGEPLRLGSRLLTFALVVFGGLAASIAFGIALRSAGLGIGWNEANANATALIAIPLAWSILLTILLMIEGRRSQVLALAITSLPLLPALLAGS
ncbi:hypothetical protein D2V17_01175 [Aurantiacibacter xanthus]|uniref:Uncharacterized protein n=1 Tax=Aurantiacibacter xanthus TaxID=1784712 RepID=A0A3A1PGS5_9SPHN|nr:hypothetical protein [Aurantiacibacter xanthus]RIV92749.1 hypothetical protein D2V17_01175 [Aurantiacibacter xanthus]